MAFPPEDRAFLRGQIARAKAELDERLDADLQHPIEENIHILKVIDDLPIHLAIDKHIVMIKAVETQVAEAALAHRHEQLLLPVGAQTFIGAPCSDTGLPEMSERFSLSGGVCFQFDRFHKKGNVALARTRGGGSGAVTD